MKIMLVKIPLFCLVLFRLTLHSGISQDTLTVTGLLEDYSLFRQALQEAHPGLYRYNSRGAVDSLFRNTETLLDHNMTRQEFYQLLLPVVAQIKCGHTKLHPDNNWTDNYFFSQEGLFPYKLFFREDRAWIMDSYDSSSVVTKGLEVISVNGDPVPGIIRKMLSGFFSDGNNETFKYLEMSKFFSAYYANLYGAPDTFIIGCREGDRFLELKVAGVDKSQIEHYARQYGSNPPYVLSFPAERTALLTIRSFWSDDDRVGFRQFLKRSFAQINAKGIEHLIIDVRDNEGGIDKRGSMLLSYLVDREFRYYDRLETTTRKKYTFADHARLPRFYGIIRLFVSRADSGRYVWKHNRNLKTRKPQKQPFKGKVYVLINGASFSVTAEFAAVTHFLKRATFIGEETGGGYYGNNSGTFVIVTLPNSRLNVGIPMLAYYTAVSGYPYSDRGVIPDHEVKSTINDMLSGRDVVLDYTLRMIRQKNEE